MGLILEVLALGECLEKSGDIFGYHSCQGWCYWRLAGRCQDALNILRCIMPLPPTKDIAVPKVHSAQIQKPLYSFIVRRKKGHST